MSCIPRKKVRSAKLFTLDSCGRIPVAGNTLLDVLEYESITYKDEMDPGERELITNIAGLPCVDDEACPIDRGVMVTLNECKENDALAQLAGFGNITQTLGIDDGFDRTDYNCSAQTALEIVFDIPSLCDAAGDPQCIAMFFPLVKLYTGTSADHVINGKTTVRGAYTARGMKNARLFENFGGVLPTELAHWQPWIADFSLGTQYYLRRIMDCPAATPKSCDLRAITP